MNLRRPIAAAALLLSAAPAAFAAPALAPHQLWVGHLLAGAVLALVAFLLARWWAWAGIAFVASLWYVVPVLAGGVPAEAVAQFGPRYPFHVMATAWLVPLTVVAGIAARRNREGWRF